MIFPDKKIYAKHILHSFLVIKKFIKHFFFFVFISFIETSCTVHAGVPEEIVKRAAAVLDTVSNNNHVERLCNENISAQDRQCKVKFQFQDSN